MNLIQHDFGSPKDLKLSNTDFEKEFTTRKEACQYLKSLDTKDILKCFFSRTMSFVSIGLKKPSGINPMLTHSFFLTWCAKNSIPERKI